MYLHISSPSLPFVRARTQIHSHIIMVNDMDIGFEALVVSLLILQSVKIIKL